MAAENNNLFGFNENEFTNDFFNINENNNQESPFNFNRQPENGFYYTENAYDVLMEEIKKHPYSFPKESKDLDYLIKKHMDLQKDNNDLHYQNIKYLREKHHEDYKKVDELFNRYRVKVQENRNTEQASIKKVVYRDEWIKKDFESAFKLLIRSELYKNIIKQHHLTYKI